MTDYEISMRYSDYNSNVAAVASYSLRRACPRNISRARRMKCQRQCQKHWVYTLYDSLPVRQSSSCINFAPNLRLMMRDALRSNLSRSPIATIDIEFTPRFYPANPGNQSSASTRRILELSRFSKNPMI